jgi:hypothetical protein
VFELVDKVLDNMHIFLNGLEPNLFWRRASHWNILYVLVR